MKIVFALPKNVFKVSVVSQSLRSLFIFANTFCNLKNYKAKSFAEIFHNFFISKLVVDVDIRPYFVMISLLLETCISFFFFFFAFLHFWQFCNFLSFFLSGQRNQCGRVLAKAGGTDGKV